jgi:hypothetical protein
MPITAALYGVVNKVIIIKYGSSWQAIANYSSGICRQQKFWGFHGSEN